MVTLIAELASNHGGDIELAARMIRDAAACGATHAKVQAYQTKFLSPDDPQFRWLQQAELSEQALVRLAGVCHDEGIKFLATAFDAERLVLLRDLGAEVKIGSGEANNRALRNAARDLFVHVYVGAGLYPHAAWYDNETPLYGVSAYPAELSHALLTLARVDGVAPWGYSDHTAGSDACEFALALGASALEVHVALAGSPKRLQCDKGPAQLAVIAEWCRNGPPLALDLQRVTDKAREKFDGRWSCAHVAR